jgi:Ala-tRNA(Pro) deacylase
MEGPAMTIAHRVADFLIEQDADYELVSHPHSFTSMETAQLAHVSGDRLAKSVLLEDERGYVLAVIPASCKVDLGELHRQTSRHLGLATEYELGALFADCEPGAIPPIGTLYGMEMIVDESLMEQSDIWFEAGDHESLVHVSGETFENLLADVMHSGISRHL